MTIYCQDRSDITVLILQKALSDVAFASAQELRYSVDKAISFLLLFSGGKITGGMCSVSGVLLITPFLPIIFNKFNRFQELEKESSTAAKNKKSHPPITTAYTQYEINDKYLERRIRRRYTM